MYAIYIIYLYFIMHYLLQEKRAQVRCTFDIKCSRKTVEKLLVSNSKANNKNAF
jgi:hypothetical protein